MLTEYIVAAMRQARYEMLTEESIFYGEIPEMDGVYAESESLEACREELQEVLEEWILLGVALHHPLPVVDGIELRIRKDVA